MDLGSNKYAISFGVGEFKVRELPDIALGCLDSNCNPCIVVLPRQAYKLLGSKITEYENTYVKTHNIAITTIGCKNIDTENPVFMPIALSVSIYKDCYVPLSRFIMNHYRPPKELATKLLESIEFVDCDDKLTLKLMRRSKNLKKGDLFTRDRKDHYKVEVYITYQEKE